METTTLYPGRMRHVWPALLALVAVLLASAACYNDIPGPIKSFTAEKSTVTKGTATKLTAVFDGVGTIDNGIGEVASGVAVDTLPLKVKTTFTLTVVKGDTGEMVSESVDVDVVDAAKITSFKPDKVILPGQSTNLTAVFTGGTGVVDMGIGPVKSGVPVSTGVVPATKTYTLTVTNPAGDAVTAMAEVEAAVMPVITSFGAPNPVVSRFAPTMLTAVFTGGKGVVDQGVGPIVSKKPAKTPDVPLAGATYTLTVTNGLGVAVTQTLTVTTKKEMFVTNYDGDVFVFDADANGDVPPKREILTREGKNANSGITGLLGIVVTNDSVFLANENGTPGISIFGIGDREDVVPKGTISGGAGWVAGTAGPYLISMADSELFVPEKSSTIRVWNVTDRGAVAPKRTIEGAATKLDNSFGTWVDSGELYVTNNANGNTAAATVTVYPQTASGNATPTRTFPLSGLSADVPSGVLVSGSELFVCSAAAVTVFDKNSGAQLRQIAGGVTGLNAQACQCSIADGDLFCASDINNQVVVFPTNADGNVAPKRIVKGANSLLEACGTVVVF